ncbi:MAG TPA: M14 family zinc carboxypeptidase [Thermoanaerobaculia bacterium]|nr:M14 family zinc carboxypeptidase [Thermoanaerobaculia bacterium]
MSRKALALAFLFALGGLWPAEAEEPVVDPTSWVVRVWSREHGLLRQLAERYDFWSFDWRRGFATVRVSAEGYRELEARGLLLELDEERTRVLQSGPEAVPGQLAGIPGFPCYRTVEETYNALAALAAAHPELASWIDYGDSWEKLHGPGAGYDLRALALTNQAVPGPKFPFVLLAAIHARELTTAELATRFAEQLVNGYGSDADATWLLDYGVIYILPQQNPDGRKKAEMGLLWRKNVDSAGCGSSNSRGIDLNRNSDYFWGGASSSSDPCSDIYRGASAASEPETAAVQSFLETVFADQRGPQLTDPAPATTTGLFISLHSYGELVLYPWEGLDAVPAPNLPELQTFARKLSFLNGYNSCEDALGPAGGTTVDQAYGELGVASYTFEMGTDFFESCATAEASVFPPNLVALRYAAKAARRPYQEPSGPETLSPAVSASPVPAGTPVILTAIADDTRSSSNGCGGDPAQAVTSASYTVDQPPWLASVSNALSATDGTFNSSVEALTGSFDTTGLAPGRHRLYLVATDALGHQGVPSAVFLDITASTPIFADGFETGTTAAWAAVVP